LIRRAVFLLTADFRAGRRGADLWIKRRWTLSRSGLKSASASFDATSAARHRMEGRPIWNRPRTLPTARQIRTPRNSSSARAAASAKSWGWWKTHSPVFAKAHSVNVSPAAKRSTLNGWKPCPGPGTALRARKNWNRVCSKPPARRLLPSSPPALVGWLLLAPSQQPSQCILQLLLRARWGGLARRLTGL